MRTTIIMLAIVALCAASFAAGNAAKLKFPWAGAKWNESSDLTKIEAKCLERTFWPPPGNRILARADRSYVSVRWVKSVSEKDCIVMDAEVFIQGVATEALLNAGADALRATWLPDKFPVTVRFWTDVATNKSPLFTSPAK